MNSYLLSFQNGLLLKENISAQQSIHLSQTSNEIGIITSPNKQSQLNEVNIVITVTEFGVKCHYCGNHVRGAKCETCKWQAFQCVICHTGVKGML